MSAPDSEHAIAQLTYKIAEILDESGYPKPEIWRSSPVTTVEKNYDALMIPEPSPSRSPRHTRYLDCGRILRTHTSGLMPEILKRRPGERLMLHPGICYRRDVRDRTHVGEPHQMDIWLMSRKPLGRADLKALVGTVMSALPYPYRLNETEHPYTLGGLEIEVSAGDRWVEVGECGIAHPSLLPDGCWGLAMGVGLDRLVCLLKGIDDIRLLRSDAPAISRQMRDLKPYRPVSKHPAVVRDISIVADGDTTIEDLTEWALRESGGDADIISEISILAETGCEELSARAIARLGIEPHQKNVLMRIVLRRPDRALTKAEANRIRDKLLKPTDKKQK